MPIRSTQASLLALSLLGGRWDKVSIAERLSRALDGFPIDHQRLAARLVFRFEGPRPPLHHRLTDFLSNDEQLNRVWSSSVSGLSPRVLLDPPAMAPPPEALISFPLPVLETWKDLRLWLGLFDKELAWLADVDGRQAEVTAPKLHHYRYRWQPKRNGGRRLIEIPKARLKEVQRQILRQLLDRVPAHPSAHGFRRHRSCLTYAAPHVAQPVVLRMDLKDFFHSVPVARIGALFRTLGYPQNVARTLQGLCTHRLSPSLAGDEYWALHPESRNRLRTKHLPQGAPTSPAIANLCAWRLDCRLEGLARHLGLAYSRYADDLAFSGPESLGRLFPFLQGMIGAIASEEGFSINHRKTRVMTRAGPQQLGGMVVNEKPNLKRADYDRLKAILHNCVRFGPQSQNREGLADFKAYLSGRVAYAAWLNPERGERLKAMWKRIRWEN